MTWSTAGMSSPRAAISVARRIALGVALNLPSRVKVGLKITNDTSNGVPIEILEALALLQLRMQGKRFETEELQ